MRALRKIAAKIRKPKLFVHKGGNRLAVLRPENTELALQKAERLRQLSGDAAEAYLNSILYSQPYTFVGLLGFDRRFRRADGSLIEGSLQPGDSFASYEPLYEAMRGVLQVFDDAAKAPGIVVHMLPDGDSPGLDLKFAIGEDGQPVPVVAPAAEEDEST